MIALFLATASAQNWNAADGDWSDGTKWSGGNVPIPGNTVYINNALGGTVHITDEQFGGILYVGYTNGASGGFINRLTIETDGKLITNGDNPSFPSWIGYESQTHGVVTVNGIWESAGAINAGLAGHGEWIIGSGGVVSSVGLTTLGRNLNSIGTALVRGTLSNTGDSESGNFRVGVEGSGMLTIGAGGVVNVRNGIGKVSLASFGTVGSLGVLNIGGVVNGQTPEAAEGAGVLNASEVAGHASGGTSTVNFNHTTADYYFTKTGLSGGDSILISGATTTVNVYAGKTTLSHSNTYGGGTIVSGATAHLVAAHNNALGTAGTAKVRDAGILEVASGITLSRDVEIDGGQLLLSGGTAIASFTGTGGSVTGSGSISNALTVTFGNTISAGNGAGNMGALTLSNTLTLASGSTSIFDIQGFTVNNYDLISGSSISFHGTLNVAFQSGFNQTGFVKIFDFSTYNDTFSNVHFTGLASGYSASFDHLTGIVTVVPEPSIVLLVGLAFSALVWGRRRRS